MPTFIMLTKQQRIRRRGILVALYSLERTWGVSADLYRVTAVNPDFDTGKNNTTRQRYHIPRMITHGIEWSQKFEYDLSFLAANKNFTYGGVYVPGDRMAVVRNTFGLTAVEMKDYIVYDGKRYAMQRIEALDYQAGWILHLRHTPDVKPLQIHARAVWSRVTPTNDIEVVE